MAKSVEVPTHTLPDGREFITEQDAVEYPEVMRFLSRFPGYWKREALLCGWVRVVKNGPL